MKIRTQKNGWYSYINQWFKAGKAEYYGAKIAVYEENGHVKGLIHFDVSLDDLIDEDEDEE